ncbi:phosphate signaling complex protein PhoU [Pseudorhodobacter sp. MZDSW-24AT]|uniref:phosphate signaling complex protein PhoU n=1 Tax=Pseudorhodobacter sp. MZDSW-24AT TaxID=2052957 RepID=UPI000C1E216F|nr:phosphate signaling complex protein PhoU [Pseudorhodobacter sp. MZDSW-24AT]PJF09615.1 phosphate transport system regulatory protein PhoU [Pseudorhodobacter sp. MZDSW-24AT]
MQSDPHILRAFDRDLEAVQALVLRMGTLVEEALLSAARGLRDRDIALAQQVRQGDAAVDALEEQINQECARVIALRAPTASDLRTVLTVMKVASNLERCGDYAKNLAKRSTVLNQSPPIGDSAASVYRMATAVQQQLKDALDAYLRRDAELAAAVRLRDQEIDQIYSALFREILTHMMEDPRHITGCMHLHFIAKNIERVGDHATGIAEQVIYLVTGTLPADQRPKGDTTAFETGA